MKFNRFAILTILSAIALFMAVSAQAVNTTYVWQSNEGDRYNLTGTIVLNSSSGVHGSVADIVSITLSDDETPTIMADLTSPYTVLSGGFAWNSTKIINMSITAQNSAQSVAFLLEAPLISNTKGGNVVDEGAWIAQRSAVPDRMRTLPLLVFSITVTLILFRRLSHRPPIQN